MSIDPETIGKGATDSFSRRTLLSVLPAKAFGCLACARALACPQTQQSTPSPHSWTEKADMTWEDMFRFAYQKDLIPMLKELGALVGREELTGLLRKSADEVVRKKSAGRPPVVRDLTSFAANLKNVPPLIQHALEVEIVEQSPEAFEYHVTRCLWAKMFRSEDAADIGYAMVCYPDFAVAKSLNPKLQLIRTKTLMQGDDGCSLRYVMQT